MATKSLSEIKQLFEKLFPERTLRLRWLSLLADHIRSAQAYVPDNWIVRLHPHPNRDGICLIVGDLVPFKITRGKIWMALDQEQLDETFRGTVSLNSEQSWRWETKDCPVYKYVPSRNGYYFPNADPSEKLLPVIWKLNAAFIKRIGDRKRQLRPRSREAYQPTVLEFLHQELKQPIPEPKTQRTTVIRTDFALPEEISEDEVFYEGTGKQISVNAYERNQGARDKCLKRYGFRCAVCKQCMSETYGTAADKLIHVHHLKPLSEIEEGYEVNPFVDLRPVCPNCHAVIHRRKPPYTIEEVKGFLEKGRQNR